MGESVLRRGRNPEKWGRVWVIGLQSLVIQKERPAPKGNQVNIPGPGRGKQRRLHNASGAWQHKRASRRRRKHREEFSFLFNGHQIVEQSATRSASESGWPETRRDDRQSVSLSETSGWLSTALENRGKTEGTRRAWLWSCFVMSRPLSGLSVPITAAGLQGEQPLVDETMWVREVGKIDLYLWKKDWLLGLGEDRKLFQRSERFGVRWSFFSFGIV